jgi:hypothetical protein
VPRIKQIPIAEATGLLKEEFDKAVKRAGKVFNIVHIQSLNPQALRDSINFYITLMKRESPLSRAQREMLATVVSVENRCFY